MLCLFEYAVNIFFRLNNRSTSGSLVLCHFMVSFHDLTDDLILVRSVAVKGLGSSRKKNIGINA